MKTVRKNSGNTTKLRLLSYFIHCKFSSAERALLGLYLNTASHGNTENLFWTHKWIPSWYTNIDEVNNVIGFLTLKSSSTMTPCKYKHEAGVTAICQTGHKMTGQSNWKNIQALHPCYIKANIMNIRWHKVVIQIPLTYCRKHARSSKPGSKVNFWEEISFS